MPLTSPQNPLLVKVRRAVDSGRPMEDGTIAAEGPHLLSEATSGAWKINRIFCSTEAMEKHRALLSTALSASGLQPIEVVEVGTRAFKAVSDTEHTQGIVSLLCPRHYSWPELFESDGPLLILDGIQDPGNAGAITRSAEAFGACGVVFADGCVRISNGKLLRASAGSLFRLPFVENCARAEIISQIRAAKRRLFLLSAAGGNSLFSVSLQAPFALAVGSEGMGVSPELGYAGERLSIPTHNVESLNAAVACSVTLFEAARQRTIRSAHEPI